MSKVNLHFTPSDIKTVKRLMKKCEITEFSVDISISDGGAIFYKNTSIENFKHNYGYLNRFDSSFKSLIESKLTTVDIEAHLSLSMKSGDKAITISVKQ